MPTRCNGGFYCRSHCLLNMFRASLCPSSGAQEYYTVVAACGISCCGFSSSWSGVELRVMCLVCRMLQHPANRTHNPQLHTRPATWKTTARNTTRSNHCIMLLSSWWWAYWCPKHVDQAIRSAIKTSVASRWHFISTYSRLNLSVALDASFKTVALLLHDCTVPCSNFSLDTSYPDYCFLWLSFKHVGKCQNSASS